MDTDGSAEQLESYRRTARARWQTEQEQLRQRREQAWQLARQAADVLRQRYAVERVVIFGSLIHAGRFAQRSDVDLAAWGLTAANWLRAAAAVRDLSEAIDLNLVDVGCCSPELLRVIEQEGIPL